MKDFTLEEKQKFIAWLRSKTIKGSQYEEHGYDCDCTDYGNYREGWNKAIQTLQNELRNVN